MNFRKMVKYMKPMWIIILAGATPLTEVKGAIPLGIALGYTAYESLIFSLVGNLIMIPILLFFLRPVFNILKKIKWVAIILERIEAKTLKKSNRYAKFSLFGLFLLVAIPLPGTGVYTGCLAASLLDVRYKYAFPLIIAGGITSGLCIYLLSVQVLAF